MVNGRRELRKDGQGGREAAQVVTPTNVGVQSAIIAERDCPAGITA
jgi:hypothetical protein